MMQPTLLRFEPRTPLEACEVARDSAAAGYRLAFSGGGTHAAPRADVPDAVVSTLGMRAIVEYAAEDQTVTVETGITLAELGRQLAASGQRLVVDVAEPERATVGGAIAANAYGPRRMRYGSLKDLILGVTLVRADGTAARAGGKVVKNVAGFDLSKLVVGSYGTLALITTATLRVHPLPERTRAVRASGMSAEATWTFVLALRARQLEPAAIVATRSNDATNGCTVDVLFEGFAAGVDAQIATLLELSAASAIRAEEFDWAVASETDRLVRGGGPLRIRCTTRPSDFAATDRDVVRPVLRTLDAAAGCTYPALGVTFVYGEPRDATLTREALVRARADLERGGGSLVVEAFPHRGDIGTLDTWGTPPASFGLMRQLKARFDPLARLNPGCFVGGI